MTTSPSLRVYAADEEGGDSGGGDSGSNDGGGQGDKQESKSSDSGDSNDGAESKNEESSGDSSEDSGAKDVVKDEPKNPEDLKGTPEEQETAAVEDYINEEPGIKKPYPPVTGTKPGVGDTISKGVAKCYGPDGCKIPIKKEPFNCKDGKWTKGCVPIHPNPVKCVSKWDKDCKPDNGTWCKQHPGKCGDGPINTGCDKSNHNGKCWPQGCKEKWHQDWAHNGKCGGGKGGGHHHNDWCDSHNCHNHHHHSSTHFSDNHKGDVTVKVDVRYDEKSSKNLEDVHLIIGDVYDKSLDLSDKPDQIKVDNLDIDGGDSFAVCLANEDSDEGDCVVTEADNDHATETVKLTVF